jgi:hypothetical protein
VQAFLIAAVRPIIAAVRTPITLLNTIGTSTEIMHAYITGEPTLCIATLAHVQCINFQFGVHHSIPEGIRRV